MSRIKRKQFQVAGCAVVMVLASSLATSSAASPGSPGQNTDESMEQGPVRAHTTASDTADAGSTELWQRLSGFDQAKRDNAIIHLEMGTAATKKQANTGKQIVSLWNSGSNGEAIELLRALEETGAPVAVGVAWKRPVPVGTNAAWSGSDVRVGAPRAGTSRVMLAAGRDHILATILWSTGESKGWSMNVSADDGATWSETYHLYADPAPVDVHMSPRGGASSNYVYVGYALGGDPFRARLSRFLVDGSFDTGYGVFLVFDRFPASIVDVDVDLREEWDGFISFCWFLDYRAILNDGKLLWYCDALCDGDENDFADVSPYSITNALGGLSVSTRGSGNIYLPPHYMSYISTDQKVHISTHSGYDYLTMPFTGTHLVTALGVCEEFVICCYEHAYPSGQGIKCWLKCSEGSPWSGSAIAEPRPGEGDFMMPDVACFYDGCAATYQQDLSGVDGVFVRVRLGLGSGPPSQWLDPVQFNDYDIDTVYASPPTITHVGATSEECCYSYGTAYISGNQLFYPPQTRPYFDRAPGPGDYCQACGTWHPVYIANVDVGSISRPSGNTRYAEYTEYSTQMGIGLSHELTVTLGNGSQSCQGGVWIDWNQDQDFDDAGEAISVNGSPGAGPYTATISPPVSAVLGETRMRIRVTSDQTPQPCSGQDEGEVEDYTVEVVNYCEASSGCGQYISRVEFAGMDNSSVCDGYAYYPGLVGDIQRGLTYPATITIANGYSGNFGGLWFDWNHDLDFFDPGEEISLSPSFGPGPYTAIVTVPLYANLGLTRMRVRLHRETDWTWPCDDEPFGEVEDYVVNITESPYCLALSECDHYISRVQFGAIDNVSDCPLGWYGYSDFTDQWTGLDIGSETPIPMTITIEYGEEGDRGAAWIDWNQDFDFNDVGESIPLTGTPGPGPYTAAVMPPPDAAFGDTRMRIRTVRDHEPLSCGEQSIGETEDYTVTVNFFGYCIGYGGCTEYIGRVELGDIDNSSGCSQGYSNYDHLSTSMLKNEVYVLTITAGQSYPDDRCSVWIDWNQDMDFTDDGESIPVNGTPGMGPYTALIVPRPDASVGQTRMRVRLDRLGPYGPCDAADYGEVEDYTIEVVGYCDASAECDAYVSRVQIGDIDNTSSCNTGYSDYTSLSTELAMDVGSDITVTVGNSAGYEYGAVFIDWNQDMVFGYPSEEIPLNGSPGQGPYTATVTPPPGAVLGETRMRVRVSSEEDPPGPCGPTEYGEVEDYSIVVTQCPRWDLVRDGCINLEDLAVFATHWLESPCAEPDFCGCADLYADGVVNLSDYGIFSSHWLEGCP